MIVFDTNLLKLLIQNKISITDLEIGAIKLGDKYWSIDVDEITDLYIENNDDENLDNNTNLTFKERLSRLENYNGYIHLAGGLSCSIRNKIITDFNIEKKYLEPICEYTRADIIAFYGKPNVELIEEDYYGGYSYGIEAYIIVYKNKKINFTVDAETEKLIAISSAEINCSHLKKR